MKLSMGPERVIVQGIRPEEQLWGGYQFPRPYDLGDRLVVAVHVASDDIKSFGQDNRWFESRDRGVSWQEIGPEVSVECGLRLPNGDRIYFLMENGVSLRGKYRITEQKYYTPGYDFTARAPEGTLPIPDGITYWLEGTMIRAYNADRLPESLSKKQWLLKRIPAGQTQPVTEYAQVDWPYLTRVVYTGPGYEDVLKPIFPRSTPKLGPDGAVWVSAFSGEGHLDPENGQYSPYYSAELFRSEDGGRTFSRRAHMEYPADGHAYPYQSGGFSDSDFAWLSDGSMIWFFRSTWYAYTGCEWGPMYVARSRDGGFTWTKPEKFADVGILPRLCPLPGGPLLLCYARPGMYVAACDEPHGIRWSEPLEAMTPGDRSGLHNLPIAQPTFHEWVGACNNPELLALDARTALLFYSDFYYPAPDGGVRKTILCREIRVD